MKEEFPEFYLPTQQEFNDLWKKSTFILDANVLLNLYRYSSEACQELTGTLETLSKLNRLWIPHQAALEYQKNRLGVINEEKSKLKSVSRIIDIHTKSLKDDLKKDEWRRKNTSAASMVSALEKVIDNNTTEIKKELQKHLDKQPDRIAKDEIREKLSDLLKGRIGIPYDQNKLEDLYREAEKRYELKMPPGYEDTDKEGRAKYGDVILWFQIIDYSKKNKLPVILITDDKKIDWWNAVNEGNDKTPNYELIREFISKTGLSFYMYSTDRFLFWAKKQIGAEVSDKTIKEIEQVKSFLDYLNKGTIIKPAKKDATIEVMTIAMESPEFAGLIKRLLNGEKIESIEFSRALANTEPEIASRIFKAIVDQQTPIKDGEVL